MDERSDANVRHVLSRSDGFRFQKHLASALEAKKVQIHAFDSSIPMCSECLSSAYHLVLISTRSDSSC